jgi:predicted ATP-dependent serine protease
MNTLTDITASESQVSNGHIIDYPKPDDARGQAVGSRPITSEILTQALLPADSLATAEIKPRENLCGTWFRQGDLGFIFGQRGLGKTWLALDVARALAEGRQIGPWPIQKSRRVLYVDGEMPLDGIRDRNSALRESDGPLDVLNHEWLFQKTGHVLNLSDISTQDAILALCEAERFEVLILDNLSCLFSGMAENDADAWERVLPWLLEMRRHKIAVVIVHHSGRAGQHMRGTSKREDAAFWVIRLDPVSDAMNGQAAFITRFAKHRQGTNEELEPFEWHYESQGQHTRVTFKAISSVELFKQWLRDGLISCSDISEEMGLTKGAVSKLAKRGERDGWLKIEGRNYRLIEP